MSENKVKFEHRRSDFVQAVYGNLKEEASFLALEQADIKLKKLLTDIDKASKEDDAFCHTKAIEMAYSAAETEEEKIIFIFKIAESTRCPNHGLLDMLTIGRPPE